MKIYRFAIILLVFALTPIALAGPRKHEAVQPKRLTVVPSSGPLAGQAVYAHSYALLVGVNRYPHLPPGLWLHYADADALALRDVLVRSYGFPARNVQVLTDAQATKQNIEDALASFADQTRIGLDDRILIFFSGHGQTVPLSGGGEMGFLIPSDADVDLTHPDNSAPYLRSCLRMNTIWGYLESSPAKHVLLLADACYSGLLTQQRSLVAGTNATAALAQETARQVITAGTKGQTASELSRYGHGAFTYKLLEELQARASVPGALFTASDLFGSLTTDVADVTGGQQLPQIGNYNSEGQFLFITTPPQAVVSAVPDADANSSQNTEAQPTDASSQTPSNTSNIAVTPTVSATTDTNVPAITPQMGIITASNVTPQFLAKDLNDAVEKGREKTVQTLLEQGADPNGLDRHHSPALVNAARRGNQSVVDILIQHGATINATNKDGQTALMQAATSGKMPVMNQLVEHRAAMDAKDKDGQTVLIQATSRGSYDAVDFLLQHGATVDTTDASGRTALMQAVALAQNTYDNWDKDVQEPSNYSSGKDGKMTSQDIANSISSYDNDLKTARKQADETATKYLQIVRVLLKYGADPHLLSAKQETADSLARNQEILDVLATAQTWKATQLPAGKALLPAGSRIDLELQEDLKSGSCKVGQVVHYTVIHSLIDENKAILIPVGTQAFGKVTQSSHRGKMGKPGKLDFTCDYIVAPDGTRIALRRGEKTESGKDNSIMAGLTAVMAFPVAPFINGRDVTVRKSQSITVYVDQDTLLSRSSDNPAPASTPE